MSLSCVYDAVAVFVFMWALHLDMIQWQLFPCVDPSVVYDSLAA